MKQPRGLFAAVREKLRTHHCPPDRADLWHWARRFVRFHGQRHPREVAADD